MPVSHGVRRGSIFVVAGEDVYAIIVDHGGWISREDGLDDGVVGQGDPGAAQRKENCRDPHGDGSVGWDGQTICERLRHIRGEKTKVVSILYLAACSPCTVGYDQPLVKADVMSPAHHVYCSSLLDGVVFCINENSGGRSCFFTRYKVLEELLLRTEWEGFPGLGLSLRARRNDASADDRRDNEHLPVSDAEISG